MNSTNFPKSGTTNDVGGIISANNKKNTVNDSKIEILRETYLIDTNTNTNTHTRLYQFIDIDFKTEEKQRNFNSLFHHYPMANRKPKWLEN